jgi:hypothetical protein
MAASAKKCTRIYGIQYKPPITTNNYSMDELMEVRVSSFL